MDKSQECRILLKLHRGKLTETIRDEEFTLSPQTKEEFSKFEVIGGN